MPKHAKTAEEPVTGHGHKPPFASDFEKSRPVEHPNAETNDALPSLHAALPLPLPPPSALRTLHSTRALGLPDRNARSRSWPRDPVSRRSAGREREVNDLNDQIALVRETNNEGLNQALDQAVVSRKNLTGPHQLSRPNAT